MAPKMIQPRVCAVQAAALEAGSTLIGTAAMLATVGWCPRWPCSWTEAVVGRPSLDAGPVRHGACRCSSRRRESLDCPWPSGYFLLLEPSVCAALQLP
jgi:hypothetical protein